MVHLVLVFCLVSDGDVCLERRPVSEALSSLPGCVVTAQPTAAQFLREHSAYRLASWRCEVGRPPERAA